jgi:hypothetical protein
VLELTALVARKQPERYGRFAARWFCLYVLNRKLLASPKDHLEEHEKADARRDVMTTL